MSTTTPTRIRLPAVRARIQTARRTIDRIAKDRSIEPRMRRAAMIAIADIGKQELADELGVSRQMVSVVLHGGSASDRIERAIADLFGLEPDIMFPERKER